jgi:hypothetical protein
VEPLDLVVLSVLRSYMHPDEIARILEVRERTFATKTLSDKLLSDTGKFKQVVEELISKQETDKNKTKESMEEVDMKIIEEKSAVEKKKTRALSKIRPIPL